MCQLRLTWHIQSQGNVAVAESRASATNEAIQSLVRRYTNTQAIRKRFYDEMPYTICSKL